MKTFLITRQLQMDFMYHFDKNLLETWYNKNKSNLDEIGEELKNVKFEKYEKDTCTICGYICKNFSSLIRRIWESEIQNSKEKKVIKEFDRKIKKYYNENTFWKLERYKHIFDKILYEAGMQHQIDIRIEGKDYKIYNDFSDAIGLKNGIKRSVTNTTGSSSLQGKSSNHLQNSATSTPNIRQPSQNQKQKTSLGNEFKHKPHENHKIDNEKSRTLPNVESIQLKKTRRGSRDSLDEQFLRTLKSQEARFEKELREKRQEREEKKMKAYQELIRLRKESRARLQAFMACLQLKIRWEQQEQDWSDWLKDTRAPLIRIKTKFIMFSSKWRRTDEDENKEEALYIQNLAQEAYYTLVFDFEMLQELAYKYLDKLFLKVLQKQISQVATKLCDFIEELGRFENYEESSARIQELESRIDPLEIPTTENLRRTCQTNKMDDNSFVAPPKVLKSSPIITDLTEED